MVNSFSVFLWLFRYTLAAQELVMNARGLLTEQGWRTTKGRLGSVDDISVYIIPLMFGNRQPQSRWLTERHGSKDIERGSLNHFQAFTGWILTYDRMTGVYIWLNIILKQHRHQMSIFYRIYYQGPVVDTVQVFLLPSDYVPYSLETGDFILLFLLSILWMELKAKPWNG